MLRITYFYKFIPEKKKVETSNENFLKTFSICVDALSKIKGSFAGNDVIISIGPAQNNIYVNIKCAN